MRSVPAIARLDYLDVVLDAFTSPKGVTVEGIREAIGQAIESWALRGEARRTRDWRHPLAYRDTTVDCLRELMNWGAVEAQPLPEGPEGFDRTRRAVVRLTPEGARLAALPLPDRREEYARRILHRYEIFRRLIEILERYDVVLPEFSDSDVKAEFSSLSGVVNDQDAWMRLSAACNGVLSSGIAKVSGVRLGPLPASQQLAAGIGRFLRKRFTKRPPKSARELTGAINKAVAHVYLDAVGFKSDWNSYDRCLRWGRDLVVTNDARHAFGVSGWLSWSTADIRRSDSAFTIKRRGLSETREEVKTALLHAYNSLAASRQSAASRVPLIPIFEVRESAAFRCRVSDQVVDRVLADLSLRKDSLDDLVVELHLADLREFVPSARPFRIGEQRYYYVTIYRPGTSASS